MLRILEFIFEFKVLLSLLTMLKRTCKKFFVVVRPVFPNSFRSFARPFSTTLLVIYLEN